MIVWMVFQRRLRADRPDYSALRVAGTVAM